MNEQKDEMSDVVAEDSEIMQEIDETTKKDSKKWLIYFGLVFLFVVMMVAYFVPKNDVEIVTNNSHEVIKDDNTVNKKEHKNIIPNVTSYSVKEDLSNVTNINDFSFSGGQKEKLAKNAFVVAPGYGNEFFSLYESNRYDYTPNFITTDSILHNYHLMFDFLLRRTEEDKLIDILKELNANMLSASLKQYNTLKGAEWADASKRNVGFFAVGSKLLDSTVEVPDIVAENVEKELKFIEAHDEINVSPVMGIKEDYTQYISRGHYNKSEKLKAYFKSMMWYGRLSFAVKESDNIKSALLITLALNEGNNEKDWSDIYEPINFFVGKSDDIMFYQFNVLLKKVYGKNATLETVVNEKNKFASFVEEVKKMAPPQINSMPIFDKSVQEDMGNEIKAFRFMGQRFTIDAAIFQRLVAREVGPKGKSCDDAPFRTGRMLPKGLDIASVMGSEEALKILEEEGETDYACYPENMSKMREYISKLPVETWTQNLYWGWLHQLLPLLTVKKEGYPIFMQNDAWARKELNTFLGSWAELKHDTILYAKQVYAELGGGGMEPEEKDDRGYVEPNVEVYVRLISLLETTIDELEKRGLLGEDVKDDLSKMQKLTMSLKTISEKELSNEKLNDDEYELIRSYGGQLEHFWIDINKNEHEFKTLGERDYLTQNPASLIADVATDPNGSVLEEGVGNVFDIYVVVPIDGKLRIAKGGVYSYYEFAWPMSDRLTDKKWREMLRQSDRPPLPTWTNEFISE